MTGPKGLPGPQDSPRRMRVKRFFLICTVILAFAVAMFAQTSGTGSTGSTGSSSTGSTGSTGSSSTGSSTDQSASPSTSSSTTRDQSSSNSSMGSNSSNSSANNSSSNKDEQSGKSANLKGCISQSGSNYILTDKKHPSGVQLDPGSQDLTAHVGHKVQVKGTWEAASSASSSMGASGTGSS